MEEEEEEEETEQTIQGSCGCCCCCWDVQSTASHRRGEGMMLLPLMYHRGAMQREFIEWLRGVYIYKRPFSDFANCTWSGDAFVFAAEEEEESDSS